MKSLLSLCLGLLVAFGIGNLASAEPLKTGDAAPDFELKGSDGKTQEYTIVGPAEADPREGKISHESPVGRALIGKKVHDEVQVNAPRGILTLKITKVS